MKKEKREKGKEKKNVNTKLVNCIFYLKNVLLLNIEKHQFNKVILLILLPETLFQHFYSRFYSWNQKHKMSGKNLYRCIYYYDHKEEW